MNASKKLSIMGYGITAFVFLAVTLWLLGVFGIYYGDELAVWLLSMYIIMPITSLVVGIVMGARDAFIKWIYPIVFGVYGVFLPYLTSVRYNSTAKFSFEVISLFFSFIPALLGMLIGTFIKWVRTKKQA